MAEEPRNEVILLLQDEEVRAAVRTLLEHAGLAVTELASVERLRGGLRASRAFAVVVDPSDAIMLVAARHELAGRTDIDLLAPTSMGRALLDGALDRRRVASCAGDGLRLLATTLERTGGAPALAERVGQAAELTAVRLGLSHLVSESVGPAALLACLGPLLAKANPDTPAAEGGISRELTVAAAAAGTLRSPWPLEAILLAIEERFDGSGHPGGLAGERIPLPARIVAVARDYARSLAKGLDEGKAIQLLSSGSGISYDPRVVDAFFRVQRDTEYLRRVESAPGGPTVVVVDGDAAFLAVAELRLSAAGFSVKTHQDGRAAQEAIAADPPAAVVSEIVLPRHDGVALLAKVRRDAATAKMPVFFASATTDRLTVTKALKLGANDVMGKPVNWEVLVAKLREATAITKGPTTAAAAPRGVEGDLAQLALPDLLQVIAFGRRTSTIHLESKGAKGSIAIDRGDPIGAWRGELSGHDAFCEIASWQTGSFWLQSAGPVVARNLHGSLESLLLEAMRRQDESGRSPGAQEEAGTESQE